MSNKRKILIVDDEPHIVELVSMYLRQNGYDSVSAGDGPAAIETARAAGPDLILLDLMLPGMSGLEVCRVLRQDSLTSRIPIIMLTAKSEESDKVIGLGIGADDYVTKPFGLRELVARIEVALRHASASPSALGAAARPRLKSGELELDEASREVRLRGEKVALSPTEFDILAMLARADGAVVRRADIVKELGVASSSEEARSLDVHVRNIRRKLGPHGDGEEYVETVRGIGFRIDGRD